MKSLELQSLRKTYGGVTVLHDLSLQLESGHMLSLLGPSGCGKTTTLNIIAGFITPDAGKVIVDGHDETHVPVNKRDSAIVFQNYALFPHMRIRDNVAFGLKAQRLPAATIRERVNSVLDALGISHLADRFPSQLSGGQQQRVSVARALAVHPALLLLDEPLSNLDVKLRAEVRTQLRQLQLSLGQTAVFVTHDQEEALAVSDRIAVLNAGRLEQFGTPAEVWERPSTVFVADFMGVENIFSIKDSTVEGNSARYVAVGNETHLGFRPDAAQLCSPQDTTVQDALRFEGRVASRTYLGNTVHYEILAGGIRVSAEIAAGVTPFDQGSEVAVVVPRHRLLPLVATVEQEAAYV